jgi:hypothetical protein
MALIDDAKAVLRISNTAFNTEINDLIEAAKMNLNIAGVLSENIIITDPLIKQYILTYVKAHFGWDNPDAEKLKESLKMIETRLALASEYVYYIITFTINDGVNGVRAKVTLDGVEADTDENGTVKFYLRQKNNVEYTVSADGYLSDTNVIDVTQNETIDVTLVEA